MPRIHTAKNGRKYIRMPDGRTRFISLAEAASLKGETVDMASSTLAPAASVRVKGNYELDFNERQLGWILRGFIEAARGHSDNQARLFGPDDESAQQRREHGLLLELGSELYEHLAVALRFFEVSADEWGRWFRGDRSLVRRTESQPSLPFNQPHQPNVWLPPVVGRITSRFGVLRGEARHQGIDIAVPTGTPVLAPHDVKVLKVGFGERPGRFITAEVVREDGSFDGDGYRIFLAHLSQALVQEGQIIQRGGQLGLSGATGNATGPHLHFKVQWVEDGVFSDDVVAIDPLALIPEAVIKGELPPQPAPGGPVAALKNNQPLNVIVAPEAGRVSIGHGIIQPDTDVRVGAPDVQLQSYAPAPKQQPQQPPPEPMNLADVLDPLAGIVTAASQTAQALITPETIQAASGLVGAGSTVVSTVFPKAAPVAVPVGIAAGVVGAAAEPIAAVADGGFNMLAGIDPLDGILV